MFLFVVDYTGRLAHEFGIIEMVITCCALALFPGFCFGFEFHSLSFPAERIYLVLGIASYYCGSKN